MSYLEFTVLIYLIISYIVRLRVGIINEPLNADIVSHAFCNEKAGWFEILDNHPKFAKHVQL